MRPVDGAPARTRPPVRQLPGVTRTPEVHAMMKLEYEGEFGEAINSGADQVPSVTPQALAAKLDKVSILDVRPTADYAASDRTLEGAARVSPDNLKWLDGFAKGNEYVLFCGTPDCNVGMALARTMHGRGFSTVTLLQASLADWLAAGLPTVAK